MHPTQVAAFDEGAVAHFRRQGYVAIPGLFDDGETTALRAAFETLVARGTFTNVATDGDGETHVDSKQNLQICPLSYHHPAFAALPFHPKVRAAVTALLQGTAYKFLDQIFFKPGRYGAGTNWHQDNYYFGIDDPMNGTAMWVALHDATVGNGCLKVIPRAFDRILAHDRDPESDHHSRCWPDEDRAVPLELEAGGVVFFCFNTPHATGPNRTDRNRAGLAYHFLRTGLGKPEWLEKVQQGHPLYGPEGKHHGPIISGPDYSRGVREYGEDMEAVLTRELAVRSLALP